MEGENGRGPRHRARLAGALVLAFLVLALPTSAPGAAAGRAGWADPPVAGDVQDLESYRASLRAALADLDREGEAAAAPVAGRLTSPRPVSVGGSATARPDLAAIVAALETRPPNLEAARVGIRALLGELDRPQAARPAAADADERLRRILERPEFRSRPRPDPLAELMARLGALLWEWVGPILEPALRWIGDLWGRTWEAAAGNETTRLLAQLAGLGLVVGLIFYAVRRLRRTVGSAPAAASPEPSPPTRSAAGLRAEALEMARLGRLREAMAALFLAILLRWEESGRMAFDPSQTNRELLARARREAGPPLADRLAPLVERFDRCWYGGRGCSPGEYAEFESLAAAAWEGG